MTNVKMSKRAVWESFTRLLCFFFFVFACAMPSDCRGWRKLSKLTNHRVYRNWYTGISYWKQCLQAPLTNLSTFLDTLSLLSCSLEHRAQRSNLWPWLQLNRQLIAQFAFVSVYCRVEYGEYELDLSNRHTYKPGKILFSARWEYRMTVCSIQQYNNKGDARYRL